MPRQQKGGTATGALEKIEGGSAALWTERLGRVTRTATVVLVVTARRGGRVVRFLVGCGHEGLLTGHRRQRVQGGVDPNIGIVVGREGVVVVRRRGQRWRFLKVSAEAGRRLEDTIGRTVGQRAGIAGTAGDRNVVASVLFSVGSVGAAVPSVSAAVTALPTVLGQTLAHLVFIDRCNLVELSPRGVVGGGVRCFVGVGGRRGVDDQTSAASAVLRGMAVVVRLPRVSVGLGGGVCVGVVVVVALDRAVKRRAHGPREVVAAARRL